VTVPPPEKQTQPRKTRTLPAEVERLRLALLHQNDLFRGMPKEEVEAIGSRLPMVTARRGQVVFQPGVTGEALFLVKTGRVSIYRLAHDGRKVVLALLGPGGAFGEMPFVGQSMDDAYAEVVEDAALCIMSRVDLEDLLSRRPEIGIGLVRALARRVREMEDRLEELAVRSVPARVARLLLKLSDAAGAVEGFSHQELADLLGTSRETVSRALVEFRNQGLIEIERRHLRILDRERLQALADELGEGGDRAVSGGDEA